MDIHTERFNINVDRTKIALFYRRFYNAKTEKRRKEIMKLIKDAEDHMAIMINHGVVPTCYTDDEDKLNEFDHVIYKLGQKKWKSYYFAVHPEDYLNHVMEMKRRKQALKPKKNQH